MTTFGDVFEGYRRKTKEPENPYPNARHDLLKDGRSILPRPKNTRWSPKGGPVEMKISDLDLHPDGLATASSALSGGDKDFTPDTKPVSTTKIDGKHHVLNGYHRVVHAALKGRDTVTVQEHE